MEQKEDFTTLIDESIRLELNVAELYDIFYNAFPEDAPFWWGFVIEEKNHASILRSGKEHFSPADEFPRELLSPLKQLRDSNMQIVDLIKKCRRIPPSRETAFRIALDLERSSGEIHYQHFMSHDPASPLAAIFQRLNRNDKNHEERILAYIASHGMRMEEA